MRLRGQWYWFVALMCSSCFFAVNPVVGLEEPEFKRLHAELQPPKDEPWMAIPWKVSLLEARELAAREQKPLFIWSMDGHPLGCG